MYICVIYDVYMPTQARNLCFQSRVMGGIDDDYLDDKIGILGLFTAPSGGSMQVMHLGMSPYRFDSVWFPVDTKFDFDQNTSVSHDVCHASTFTALPME